MILDFIGPLHWFPVATDRIVGLSPKVDLSLHSAHSARSNAQSGSESSAETMHGRACEGPDSPLGTVVRHWDKAYSCYGSRQLLCEQTDFDRTAGQCPVV